MAREIIREDYRVEVYPDVPRYRSNLSHHERIQQLQDIAKSIKRHVDGLEDVQVEWDTKEICSFCSSIWELDEHGVPICCEEAAREWVKSTEDKKGK